MNKQTREDINDGLKILAFFLCGVLAGILLTAEVSGMDSQQELELVQQLAQQNAEQHKWIYGKFMCINFVGQLSIKLY